MSKNSICTLLLMLSASFSFSLSAQNFPLPTNEGGVVEYSEVVEQKDFDKTRLFKNAESFAEVLVTNKKERKKVLLLEPDAGKVIVTKKFKVYKKGLTKQISGQIRYDLEIEVKDGKYRYFFKSFAYTPYARDRYGKFKPVNRETTAISPSTKPMSISDAIWRNNLESCNNHVHYWIEQLKFEMQRKGDEPKAKEKKREEIQW